MDNVYVIIYVDDVFDELIIMCVGDGENIFVIIIDVDVNVIYIWVQKIWKKVFCDVLDNIEFVVKNIVIMIVFKVSVLVGFVCFVIKENQ